MKIAIVLLLYNRPLESERILNLLNESDLRAKNIDVLCYLDGPLNQKDKYKQEKIIKLLNQQSKLKDTLYIKKRDFNLGLKQNIVSGLTEAFKTYEAVIVLEDDLIFSLGFIDFMIQALKYYKNDLTIGSVSGYNYYEQNFDTNLIISNYADCLGWGTWNTRWPDNLLNQNYTNIDRKTFNRKNSYPYYEMLKRQNRTKDSWAIHWYAFNFTRRRSMIFSGKNLIIHDPIENSTNYKVAKENDPLWKNPETLIKQGVMEFEKSKLINGDAQLENFLRKFPISRIRRFLLKF